MKPCHRVCLSMHRTIRQGTFCLKHIFPVNALTNVCDNTMILSAQFTTPRNIIGDNHHHENNTGRMWRYISVIQYNICHCPILTSSRDPFSPKPCDLCLVRMRHTGDSSDRDAEIDCPGCERHIYADWLYMAHTFFSPNRSYFLLSHFVEELTSKIYDGFVLYTEQQTNCGGFVWQAKHYI